MDYNVTFKLNGQIFIIKSNYLSGIKGSFTMTTFFTFLVDLSRATSLIQRKYLLNDDALNYILQHDALP